MLTLCEMYAAYVRALNSPDSIIMNGYIGEESFIVSHKGIIVLDDNC